MDGIDILEPLLLQWEHGEPLSQRTFRARHASHYIASVEPSQEVQQKNIEGHPVHVAKINLPLTTKDLRGDVPGEGGD